MLVQVLVPLGLHGPTVGLGQARLVVEVAPHAFPVAAEGQASAPPVGQTWATVGAFATPVGAVPAQVRQPPVRADVATRAAIKGLVVVVRKAGAGVVPTRPLVGPALGAASEVVATLEDGPDSKGWDWARRGGCCVVFLSFVTDESESLGHTEGTSCWRSSC